MINSWGKFQRLSGSERWLLVQALLLLPTIALGLRCLGLKRLYRFLIKEKKGVDPIGSIPLISEPCLTDLSRTAQIVQIAARRGLYRANCLQQSLCLWWVLQQQGIATDLRIGVRKGEQQLDAHAWVEYRGKVLNDRPDIAQEFFPFKDVTLPLKIFTAKDTLENSK